MPLFRPPIALFLPRPMPWFSDGPMTRSPDDPILPDPPGHMAFIENKGQTSIRPRGHRAVEPPPCPCFDPQSRCFHPSAASTLFCFLHVVPPNTKYQLLSTVVFKFSNIIRKRPPWRPSVFSITKLPTYPITKYCHVIVIVSRVQKAMFSGCSLLNWVRAAIYRGGCAPRKPWAC